jgi:hypothetical protein
MVLNPGSSSTSSCRGPAQNPPPPSTKVGSLADDPCLDIVRANISPRAAVESVGSGGGRPTRPIGAFRAINVTAVRIHRLCVAPAIRRVCCPRYIEAPRRPYRSSYGGRVYRNKSRVGAEIDNSAAPGRAVADLLEGVMNARAKICAIARDCAAGSRRGTHWVERVIIHEQGRHAGLV